VGLLTDRFDKSSGRPMSIAVHRLNNGCDLESCFHGSFDGMPSSAPGIRISVLAHDKDVEIL